MESSKTPKIEDSSEPENPRETEDELNKKSNLWTTIFILAIVLIASAIYFVPKMLEQDPLTLDEAFTAVIEGRLDDDDVGYLYNGYAFVYDPARLSWVTRIDVRGSQVEIPLHYGPKQLENVSIRGDLDNRFTQREVFVTFDPNSTQMNYIALAATELTLNLAKGINAIPIAACTSNETACESRPIITCDNTNSPVIYVKKSDDTATVKLRGNCVTLEGDRFEMVRAVDRFLLMWYTIMPAD